MNLSWKVIISDNCMWVISKCFSYCIKVSETQLFKPSICLTFLLLYWTNQSHVYYLTNKNSNLILYLQGQTRESWEKGPSLLLSFPWPQLANIQRHVVSNKHKWRPLRHLGKTVFSHPLHGLLKGFTGAFPTNKTLIETTHELLCCFVFYGPQCRHHWACAGS